MVIEGYALNGKRVCCCFNSKCVLCFANVSKTSHCFIDAYGTTIFEIFVACQNHRLAAHRISNEMGIIYRYANFIDIYHVIIHVFILYYVESLSVSPLFLISRADTFDLFHCDSKEFFAH